MAIVQQEHRTVGEGEVHLFGLDFQTEALGPSELLSTADAIELDTSDLTLSDVGINATPLVINGNQVDVAGAAVGRIEGQLRSQRNYRVLVTVTTNQQQVFERELHIEVV